MLQSLLATADIRSGDLLFETILEFYTCEGFNKSNKIIFKLFHSYANSYYAKQATFSSITLLYCTNCYNIRFPIF